MKITTTLILFYAAITSSFGQSISVSNIASGSEPPIISGSSPLASGLGVLAYGYYAAGAPDVSNPTDLSSFTTGFTQIGTELSFNGPSTGFGLDNSFFFYENVITTPLAAVGETGYFILGNGTSLAGSSEYIVYNTGIDYEQGIGNTNLVIDSTDPANVLFGNIVNYTSPVGASSATQAIQFQAIPEPSSIALLGLGSLALLARRKR